MRKDRLSNNRTQRKRRTGLRKLESSRKQLNVVWKPVLGYISKLNHAILRYDQIKVLVNNLKHHAGRSKVCTRMKKLRIEIEDVHDTTSKANNVLELELKSLDYSSFTALHSDQCGPKASPVSIPRESRNVFFELGPAHKKIRQTVLDMMPMMNRLEERSLLVEAAEKTLVLLKHAETVVAANAIDGITLSYKKFLETGKGQKSWERISN